MVHPINYFVILEEKKTDLSLLLPEENAGNSNINLLGYLPKSIEHYAFGFKYYTWTLLNAIRIGYVVNFIYLKDLPLAIDKLHLSNNAVVYLINLKIDKQLRETESVLKNVHKDSCAYLIDSDNQTYFNLPNTYENISDLFSFFERMEIQFKIKDSFHAVPLLKNRIDRGYWFHPTHVNSMLLNSALGNWDFPTTMSGLSQEEYIDQNAQESFKAQEDTNAFSRQQLLVSQYDEWEKLENAVWGDKLDGINYKDQIYAPWVCVFPFTSHDVADSYLEKLNYKNRDEKFQIMKDVSKILKWGQTSNYCISQMSVKSGFELTLYLVKEFLMKRSLFLDKIGLLHASVAFSPFFRSPLCGSRLYKELSSVGYPNNQQLTYEKYAKQFQRIGQKIADETLSEEMQEKIALCPRQVVAISDLPVEWILIDNIPWAFTHDICRIPEMPASGIITHYVANNCGRVRIRKDILSKTLVVFGTEEGRFEKYQNDARILSESLGFTTKVCRSATDFYEIVCEKRPQLLIIDSHGNVDMKKRATYLLMGNDKVYPEDIVKNRIKANMVFLSACNTAPTYNSVSLLANAFFEAGSICVTSSYLPLEINDASTIYLRLLHQLKIASSTKIHRNWLSFVSYILRTSFILQPLMKNKKIWEEEEVIRNATEFSKINEKLFDFENRRCLYDFLQKNDIGDVKCNYNTTIPHYLCYSTLGRADLIVFESFEECP